MDPLKEEENNLNKGSDGHAPTLTQPEKVSEQTIERVSDEPGSLGVDIDGTNPGSRSHPTEDKI
jgi:hypothetical protein